MFKNTFFDKINSFKSIKNKQRVTLSFYRYYNVSNVNYLFNKLFNIFLNLKILGRVYVAKEGINAQISIPKIYLDLFSNILYSIDSKLKGIYLNLAIDNENESFDSLCFKIKKNIVYDGITDQTFTFSKVGYHLKAEEVNYMIDRPEVLFVDIRNDYEYKIGHFDRAINIPSKTFREKLKKIVNVLQHQKNKEIVLYCTGGIRCEKASSWMLHKGFKKIFQIENGIIGYVNRIKQTGLPLKFKGKNFVFDKRLSEKVTDDVISFCHQCDNPCDNYNNCYNKKCHLLFIQCTDCMSKFNGCCSPLCQKLYLSNVKNHTNEQYLYKY